MSTVFTFIKEARVELSKVTWPTRQRAVYFTIVVLAVSVAVAAFLGSLDWIFSGVLEKYLLGIE